MVLIFYCVVYRYYACVIKSFRNIIMDMHLPISDALFSNSYKYDNFIPVPSAVCVSIPFTELTNMHTIIIVVQKEQ